MNRIQDGALVIAAAILLASCSPPDIQMNVDKIDGGLRVKLSQDWGVIFSDRQTPCLREISLHEPENDKLTKAVWLIEAKGDVQCLDLASFTVGRVPKGWREVIGLSGVKGRTYTLRAQGIGWGETHVEL